MLPLETAFVVSGVVVLLLACCLLSLFWHCKKPILIPGPHVLFLKWATGRYKRGGSTALAKSDEAAGAGAGAGLPVGEDGLCEWSEDRKEDSDGVGNA